MRDPFPKLDLEPQIALWDDENNEIATEVVVPMSKRWPQDDR